MDVLVCFSAFIFCLLLVVSGEMVRPSEGKAESVLLLAVCQICSPCRIKPDISVWEPAQMLT